ncbi:MAG: FAD-binding protein, partial [Parasutterella excrementihominis]
MTLSRRNLLKTAGLSSLAFVPLSQTSAAGFDKEYDIVIIGAGGAGLAAACRAGELGLKAIVLEKTRIIGGSSVLCGGQFSTFGTD